MSLLGKSAAGLLPASPVTAERAPTAWTERLLDPGPDLQIVHSSGLAEAPDDPIGAQRLALWADGRATLLLDRGSRGGQRAWRGRVPVAVVDAIREALAAARFPDIPTPPIPPGPSFRVVEAHAGGDSARVVLVRHVAERDSATAALCSRFDGLVQALRGESLPGFLQDHPVVAIERTEVDPTAVAP